MTPSDRLRVVVAGVADDDGAVVLTVELSDLLRQRDAEQVAEFERLYGIDPQKLRGFLPRHRENGD